MYKKTWIIKYYQEKQVKDFTRIATTDCMEDVEDKPQGRSARTWKNFSFKN
jgi:hypothetical protein